MLPPIRAANASDIVPLHALIERAYRGDTARLGWTHEADLLDGPRTDAATLAAIIADPDQRMLVADDGGAIAGCVQISGRGKGLAYLGQLAVDPQRQSGGLGHALIAAAEAFAATHYSATRVEMTIIVQRPVLTAWYARLGYAATGELRPFPFAQPQPDSPLVLAVLERRIG